ncbi:MAG TPA: FMN-binding glutamate synthase family protein [Gammaproteobacteria bacterium]|nr:FMN-binding glutamate synthase family protein [Gammaproteobacteria bacterium]
MTWLYITGVVILTLLAAGVFIGWEYVIGGSVLFFAAVAVYDMVQRKHAVLRNFPVLGHMRYWMEQIGPELRQYWVANDKEEQPFNRSERSWIYATAKGVNNYFGFGTTELVYGAGYPIIKNATFPFPESRAQYPGDDPTAIPCVKVVGRAHHRRRPWRPSSVVNVSGMSFGALGSHALSAINLGAKAAGAYHDTGEGGVSPYHLLGAEVVFQIGTGYFGARGPDGRFSLEVVAEKCARYPQIRAISLKLSQGAKPGKGGVLPAVKVVPEIAQTRGVPPYTDCISPNAHAEFSDVDGMIDFIERIADRTGLPVGIKAAVGETDSWTLLARRMRERGAGPDFIQIDGKEGGTGAAPLTYADHVALPFKIAFARVYQIFQQEGISRDVVWIGSGKLGFPDRAIVAFAMGCDMIAMAREVMMAAGCIQSLQCHTGHCPTGVTTMDPWLQRGLVIEDKAKRVENFIKGLRKELLALSHTAGYEHPDQFTAHDIELSTGVNRFSTLADVMGYVADPTEFVSMKELTPV